MLLISSGCQVLAGGGLARLVGTIAEMVRWRRGALVEDVPELLLLSDELVACAAAQPGAASPTPVPSSCHLQLQSGVACSA